MARATTRTVLRVRGSSRDSVSDDVVAEAPVELRIAGTPLAVLMRTPGDDEDLFLGFALTEGIVLNPSEVVEVVPANSDAHDQRWELQLAPGITVDTERFQRNFYASSSCGVCGKASIDAVRVAALPLPAGPRVPARVLVGLPETMRSRQTTFEATGGLHAAAAFTPDGDLVDLREDVGRHNAVDKLVGSLARDRWPIGELLLVVSGRVSFEIAQKAAVAGVSIVCGVSAASSLAVELGEELGLTVVGFLRGDGYNVYSGAQRIT